LRSADWRSSRTWVDMDPPWKKHNFGQAI